MRQWPSDQYTLIKRSFFSRGNTFSPLDNVVVAMKGVYSSIRLCNVSIQLQEYKSITDHTQPKSSLGQASTGLALNVDVANGTFWAPQDVHQAARNFCRERNRQLSYTVFRDILKPIKDGKGSYTQSEDFKNLRRMAKLKFRVKHRGKQDGKLNILWIFLDLVDMATDNKIYTIKKFSWENGPQYAAEGAHAKNTVFKLRNHQNNTEEEITVYNYFKRTYNIDLQYWYLPLVVTDKAGMFPMELCHLIPNQRYNFKLSPDQVSKSLQAP
jgi:eukaryotic translation initiation factor 2C